MKEETRQPSTSASRTNPGSEESTIASVTNAALEALRSEVERHRAEVERLRGLIEAHVKDWSGYVNETDHTTDQVTTFGALVEAVRE